MDYFLPGAYTGIRKMKLIFRENEGIFRISDAFIVSETIPENPGQDMAQHNSGTPPETAYPDNPEQRSPLKPGVAL
jgi:hypothetical protein